MITIFLLYMDDMVINVSDIVGIYDLKQSLSWHFEMKNFGRLNYFLGLEILSGYVGYYLSQAKYTYDILAQARFTNYTHCVENKSKTHSF